MVLMHPIFLLVGGPAVGKSSTARALAARFARAIHIPVDNLRDMVVSGMAMPSREWSEELAHQVSLARDTALHMARAYHSAGFAVVLDDFYDPHALQEYRAFARHPQLSRVVLLPNQQTAHQRNAQRAGSANERGYIDEGIRISYQLLTPAVDQLAREGWVVVDNDKLSIEDTVTAILQRVKLTV